MKRILLALLLLATSFANAQTEMTPSDFEMVLIPVYLDQARPGALGSVWRSELVVRNEGADPVDVFQTECAHFCTCNPRPTTCAGGHPLAPGTLFSSFNSVLVSDGFSPANPGIFLFLRKPGASNVALNLRVRDLSRSSESAGTEIPVVRQRDMLTATAHLLNIPTDARFRQHLRIYGMSSPSGGADVRVRISALDSSATLAEQTLSLRSAERQSSIPTGPAFISFPAYGEISALTSTFPQIQASARVRIEVEPMTPGLVFWTFVSVTNNETQQVTTVTPQ
jgi:hypothetical protein